MPAIKENISGQERVKKSKVARGDNDPPVLDPRNPASKPHGTTMDQVANMESEGQAQTAGQEPPADNTNKAGKARGKGETQATL